METYRVKVGTTGEVALPLELQDVLGLVPNDTLELRVDTQGVLLVRAEGHSVGPLVDFFEDLILQDLRCDGCAGDVLKNRILEQKIQLSHSMDRLAQEGHRAQRHRQTVPWRESPELRRFAVAEEENGAYQVMMTARVEREMRGLSAQTLKAVAAVLESLEWDPTVFKRLRGPYYETYRVAFPDRGRDDYRVIYTVFGGENLVTVLNIGKRSKLYEQLKTLARMAQH
ncbi:ParE toxin of type II toxin-antitoxin system, parDE [Acididesulfobacillus acetoxydans]|uniref:Looped-hinge helix DNA binding domain, AbrB n=1 Tax=Acididesulfobacillus acetoxydans TaxID=1561005 RepID=A0A8S0XB15_9FIRM|nr:type II toxin-antitoxin system RelE/ParE family toxin [Acididesulfobacillus acetoxydans]CAA7600646.1 ParE toxin of type II toxin-antitoxin system, parDE [Acididesulfobacillus acetoxydans]CEJ09427.1 Looped-hinge helix DNA binding domain, AbrB [Acididesulfobacillus acetoxydans]